ncbi:MAG: YeeE/YedE family protein [Gammaproteobacteria bacterium]|jgi:uncharacterized membrane protein YedE/YeeE
MEELNWWLVGGGLGVGAVFGFLIQRYRFCMVSGISNYMLVKDTRQSVAFATALLVAITGTQLLELMDIVAIGDSGYRNSTLDWFGASVGGILFGVGATLAGGCVARTLARSMEGSMHSLIALLAFAIVAAITQFGFLESTRLELTHLTSVSLTTDAGVASVLSLPQWLPMVVVAAALIFFIYKLWQQNGDRTMLISGIIIGSLVVFSWYVTGVLAQDEFFPTKPSAMTMSGPLARFGYIIISGKTPALSFAISFVIGAAIMSFLYAIVSRQFKISAPQTGMVKYALLGGSLMGIGGIMAYGCNIGQGLSGISTLSTESILAVLGIMAGIAGTTKCMEKCDIK